METTEQRNAFTEGPILRPLIRFTVPIMLALFLQAMYGAVDLIVVGQFAGDAGSVSAVSTGSTMMNLPMMIIFGLTMGATVLIGPCLLTIPTSVLCNLVLSFLVYLILSRIPVIKKYLV